VTGVQMLLLSVGGLAVVAGALIARMRLRTIYSGQSAEGVVVGQSTSSGGIRNGRAITMYAPIVEFHHAGKKHKFTSSLGTTDAVATGSKVVVRYLPEDPDSTAEIGTSMRMWVFPIGALAIGAVFIALAAYDAGWFGKTP
jgi:hypothetical protein